MKKIKILCFDIEGGHGGSSRSLFYVLESIAKKQKFHQLDITVICKKNSWVKKEYKKIGIKCIIEDGMPKFTPLSKISRNIYQILFFFLYYWPKSKALRNKLLSMENIDIIHFNHISLGFFSLWCKFYKVGKLRTMHVRTLPPINFFSKLILNISKKSCNSFIYITENEKNHLHSLIGKPNVNEEIIHNPVKFQNKTDANFLQNENRFKVGVLSNFSFNRGVDRTLEIFEAIPFNRRKNFVFIFAGDMTLEKNIPNISNSFFKNKKKFSDVVSSMGYEKNFIFLGQLQKPENFINKIQVLLKPTRLDNPWGRDILEALSMGKPVISVGKYKKFVETDKTGLLQKEYNAKEIANWLIKLEKNKNLLKKFFLECKKRVKVHCNPKVVAEKLLKVWVVK